MHAHEKQIIIICLFVKAPSVQLNSLVDDSVVLGRCEGPLLLKVWLIPTSLWCHCACQHDVLGVCVCEGWWGGQDESGVSSEEGLPGRPAWTPPPHPFSPPPPSSVLKVHL